MGLWPTEKALQMWIMYHWKPKGSTDLHLRSKGFFTVVFISIEDKDKIFEGGPYFYAATGLYMQPWIMNFVPEKETFTLVPIWVRLYSLPLDYWQTKLLAAIGNKLGCFVKASEAKKRGKYTSYARNCVEMDLSGALLDEVILEVFDEDWVQTVDYEHIPFRCHKCHEHGHLFRDFPLSKIENRSKQNAIKDTKSFQKVASKGKGGKKGPKHLCNENQKASQNKYQALEENEEIANEDQTMKDDPNEKKETGNCNPIQKMGNDKEIIMNESKLELDQEMTHSETDLEDHELQKILEKEHLDLEGFLMQGTTRGIDSLPQEDCNIIQQLFLKLKKMG